MASEPESPRRKRNQNGSLHSLVASVRRKIDRNNSQRMFGPVVVLDCHGFRDETNRVQRLLQRISQSCRAKRRNSGGNIGIERCESQILSLEATLSGALSNTDGGVSRNSP